MLDTTSAADWESAIHDAIEAVTGLDVCDADDNIYSAVGGNCALNCNLKYGAAAGTCTTLKSGDAAWKDKYGDRAVEAVGWADAQLINAGYTACQYAPEAGAKMYLPTARPTFAAPTRVPVPKPTDVPTPKPSFKPTPKPTPQTQKSPEPTPEPSVKTPAPTKAPTKAPKPAPTPKPTAVPTSFPSLTPTMSQAPTRKGSITWAHVGEDVEVRGLDMHKFTAYADNSVMFHFAGDHMDCDDGARGYKMTAAPPINDAAWNNASYCLYPNGNGLGAGRWPPSCWPTYDKKGKCTNQDRECDVKEDCNRKAW